MKRVLLKLSGEALAGDKKTGFDEATCTRVAKQVKTLVDEGTQVGIVIGGGNFWRGRSSENIDRTKADQIGMLATVMNCIYVSEIFRSVGMMTQVLTPFACGSFTKLFSKDRANKYFDRNMVVFFAGGTGHPYFSTDTATVLRAIEIEAETILLAKAIDGVYDSDPKENPDAKKIDEISIQDVVTLKLGVVDMAASILCMENKMPMLVFGLNEENSIVNAAHGIINGTRVTV
ncbi:MAG: UMP kinase [Lachnospiraceae bacterium]|nr:UMP kinase [Lachnospiraceae bacterium]